MMSCIPDRDRGDHTEGHAPLASSGVPLVAMGVPEYASLGRRIETRDGARATVRYVGSVDGQDGEWVGVEWDDPARGKHDGSHDGKRYFECAATGLEPGALPASFVRAHKIRPSVTFAAAIRAKYLDGKGEIAKVPKTPGADADADADAGEAYVQSSNGQKIEIELCLKKDDPVAALAALDRVYLPDAAVATAGAPGEAAACGVVATRVRLMDLSGNLMRDWPAVARFGEEFPNLAELNLNHVRLDWGSARVVSSVPRAVCEAGENKAPFANLRVLSLNGSGCGWASARAIAAATPSLRELSLARCGVRSLGGADASTSGLEALEALNLEGNCLAEWSEVETLAPLPSLTRLHLGGNRLRRVRYPSRSHSDGAAPFASLRGLFLADNAIDEWESIDSLDDFPSLAEARLTGNPVTQSAATRHEIVARVSRLSQLNGSLIADQERKDAEIRYLRRVLGLVKTADAETNSTSADESSKNPTFAGRLQTGSEAVAANHPRLKALLGSYGELSAHVARAKGDGSMGDDMISVTLVCVAASAGEKKPLTRKIPGSTTVGKLKLLCEKLFKVRANAQRLFHEEPGAPIPEKLEPDDYDVAYLGVRDGARVLVEEGAEE